jgi:ADP-ribose pyrophosphatase YjhB (NUDIX family)
MQLPENSIIASGPVIIENGKVLLNKEHKADGISPWMFPGGEVEQFDISLEEACQREAQEELGIGVTISKPLRPILFQQKDRVIVLIHFLATRSGEITPGPETAAWDWHDIHNLPTDCTPNVYTIITDYLEQL